MISTIKTEFVKRALQDASKSIDRSQELAIRKYLKYRSGTLLNDRHFDVTRGSFMDGRLTITHPIYERFLDMRKKKSSSKNVAAWSKRSKSKIYPIHNRIIMGNFNKLGYNLLYGLTQEVKEQIIRDLDNQNI